MNQNKVNEFPKEVIDALQYYVYRLIDPRNGETFYVGKGKGNRVFEHMKGILKSAEMDKKSDKLNKIREIIAAGLDVIHIIHRHKMDEQTALAVEAAVIDSYPGASNITSGVGSRDFGPMNALEIIYKYSAEEAIFNHKILMITINRSIVEKSIYDSTRYAWKINKKKAEKADLILSVREGIIVGVFKARGWKEATIKNFPEFNEEIQGRFGFEGYEAAEGTKKYYLYKKVPKDFNKKGASNPIKYNF